MENYTIKDTIVTLEEYINIIQNPQIDILVSDDVLKKVQESRKLLEDFVEEGRIIYGVNTSMGGFVNYLVPIENAEELQKNLIHSVASNVGNYFDNQTVRAVMIARLFSLSKSVSAITIENFDILRQMINKEVYPCIPEKGSLGASGDLGPLAFIALVGCGFWKADYKGKIMGGDEALKKAGIKKMKLSYKEGLALINGTSAMVAVASQNFLRANTLLEMYQYVSALSFEGLETKIKPFDPKVHERKMHSGQLEIAKKIVSILKTSKLIVDEEATERLIQEKFDDTVKGLDRQIEDAYSIRCTPQILGPIKETMELIKTYITNELNSSSDNPLVIPEHKDVFHNGHFHGQYISMAMDFLSINMTTLSNLSDRRIDRFMDESNSNGLPAFLCKENPGLRLGLMGGQFMSTSVTAENRSLCIPLSIQSLPSTGDFQDIVSFGLIAGRRARDIIENTAYVVSFELLCACHAIDIRGNEKISPITKILYDKVREILPYTENDFVVTSHCEQFKDVLLNSSILEQLNEVTSLN